MNFVLASFPLGKDARLVSFLSLDLHFLLSRVGNQGTLESEIFTANTYKEDKTQCIPCEFGSGKFSLGTRCMTVVFPVAKPNADSVTLQWRKRP